MVELLPTKAAHAAIVIGLNLESRRSERKGRKLRDRSGREERDHHPFASNIQAGDTSRTGQENVGIGGEFRLPQDNFALAEVRDLECGYELGFVDAGEPGERIQMAQEFQIGRAGFMFIIQVDIYTQQLTPIPPDTETICSPSDKFAVPRSTSKTAVKRADCSSPDPPAVAAF